jgi:hypothetical protein
MCLKIRRDEKSTIFLRNILELNQPYRSQEGGTESERKDSSHGGDPRLTAPSPVAKERKGGASLDAGPSPELLTA